MEAYQTDGLSGNTTGNFASFIVPIQMSVAKISFLISAVTVAGTMKVAIYSESGQTKIAEATSASIGSTGVQNVTFTAVTLAAGRYYIATIPVGTTNLDIRHYVINSSTGYDPLIDLAGEPVVAGTLTVTANTMPTTFDPTAITYDPAKSIIFRLDN
jgi:hypothetical protein